MKILMPICLILITISVVFGVRNPKVESVDKFDKLLSSEAEIATLRAEALLESPKAVAYIEAIFKAHSVALGKSHNKNESIVHVTPIE